MAAFKYCSQAAKTDASVGECGFGEGRVTVAGSRGFVDSIETKLSPQFLTKHIHPERTPSHDQ